MMSDSEHPSQQRGTAFPRPETFVDLEERILNDVLGFRRIAQSLHGEAIDALRVEPMKMRERIRLTCQNLIHQFPVLPASLGDGRIHRSTRRERKHGGLGSSVL